VKSFVTKAPLETLIAKQNTNCGKNKNIFCNYKTHQLIAARPTKYTSLLNVNVKIFTEQAIV